MKLGEAGWALRTVVLLTANRLASFLVALCGPMVVFDAVGRFFAFGPGRMGRGHELWWTSPGPPGASEIPAGRN